jgi:hypothetical protein
VPELVRVADDVDRDDRAVADLQGHRLDDPVGLAEGDLGEAQVEDVVQEERRPLQGRAAGRPSPASKERAPGPRIAPATGLDRFPSPSSVRRT